MNQQAEVPAALLKRGFRLEVGPCDPVYVREAHGFTLRVSRLSRGWYGHFLLGEETVDSCEGRLAVDVADTLAEAAEWCKGFDTTIEAAQTRKAAL